MVHLKSYVMKIAYSIRNQHLAIIKTSILPQEQKEWLQWTFTEMITGWRNTYSSHDGNPLGQVPPPWAPFCPLNWQNLALLCSKHGPLEILCHKNSLLYTGQAPCHVWDKHFATQKNKIITVNTYLNDYFKQKHIKLLWWWPSGPGHLSLGPLLSSKLAKLGNLMV